MRVLAVIDSTSGAGAETSLAAMAPHLVAAGIDLRVAYFYERDGVKEELEKAGAKLFHVPPGRNRFVTILRLRRLIRSQRPEVVHTMVYEADITGRTAAFLARVPVVSSIINEMYGPEHAGTVPNRYALRAAWAADVATAKLVTRFHAITTAVADAMGPRLHVPRSKIDVIPRGRDTEKFAQVSLARRAMVRQGLGLDVDVPVVLSLARQDPQKNLVAVVRAFEKVVNDVPDAVLLLAGREGPDSARLRQLADDAGLEERVRFLGHRSDAALILAAADVLVFPSRYEGLGGILIEAMAVGVPIVCSDLPVLREVTNLPGERSAARFVDPDDHQHIAEEIVSVLTAGTDSTLQRLARQRVLDEFDVVRVSERMAAWYRSVAAHDVRDHRSFGRRAITAARRRFTHARSLMTLEMINRFGRRSVVGTCPVIVSMTTHGDRLRHAHLAVESIARGSVRPSEFVLWLDVERANEPLPKSIERLRARGLSVRYTTDVGPHTKYFPVVSSRTDAGLRSLVTADDDVLYPEAWLSELYETAKEHPTDIICHRAHRIIVRDGALAPYAEWPPCCGTTASHANFATGVSGILYPLTFQEALASQGLAFKSVCPKADDVWLNVVALRSGHQVRQIRTTPILFPLLERIHTSSGLHLENNTGGGNDRQLSAVYTHDAIKLIADAQRRNVQ